ncbi:MAG TPA: ATP-binding protein, partial [Anaeromyxobacteraceae bacterium]
EWKWMLARARVVERDGRGGAVRIVGTCADITERRRMLARLQIADRMASVGTLAAGVAHEINNPLAYVMSNVGYALEAMRAAAKASSEGRATPASVAQVIAECGGALEEAESGAERVRNIVRDLKIFSRAEDDERTSVRLDRVLQAALNLADSEIRFRARLVTDLASTPPVHANESRLAQVFLNLLVNAAQAIPEGRAGDNEIFVGTRVGPTGRAIVEIRDTGCGIPAENRKRIFDPFFTTKPVGVGTGLGLAICHGIVTALGGDIEVESEVGRGSSFRISLPAATSPEAAAPRPSPRRAPRRGRILVVDDEPLFCRSVERLLAPDHDVVSLSDPHEAIRLLQVGQRFDVILSDLAMPGMSGIELHAEVSRLASELGEGMLFVTGGAFTASAAEFLAQRPTQVLEKPLSADALRAAVADALLRSPAQAVHRTTS